MEEALRYNTGKPQLSQNPPEALIAAARVWEKGEAKYGRFNWRKGLSWTKTSDSLLRHLYAWLQGEDIDPETNESHIAHVLCNAMMLMTYIITGAGVDDRYKPV